MARNMLGGWLLDFGEGTLQRIPWPARLQKTSSSSRNRLSGQFTALSVGLYWWNTRARAGLRIGFSPG